MGSIASVAIQNLPMILAAIKGWHTAANPGGVVPTDEEVIAGLKAACDASLAKDAQWLAAHPPDIGPDIPGGGAV